MCFLPLVVWYFQGLLTPVIAVVAVYIARQQWKTNAHKLKLDLYDRRFKVFEAAREILGLMYTSGVRDAQLLNVLTKTADTEFLFGREVKEYLEEIYRHVQTLISANSQMSANWETPVEVRSRIAEAETTEVRWATGEVNRIADRFKKYLNLSKL
jgi:hypothetical protein